MENTKDNTNIWIDIDKASEMIGLSSQTLKRKCRQGEFVFKIVKKGKVAHYFILLKSMPDFAQDKYLGDTAVDLKYSEVPSWAKLQAEKYVRILDASAGLKGKELKKFIDNWNNNDEEEFTTSYPSLIKMRRRYFRYGVAGLISKHGQHLVGSCVPDDYFEYFKTLYLIEGGPSLRSCRDLTLGYAVRELSKAEFKGEGNVNQLADKLAELGVGEEAVAQVREFALQEKHHGERTKAILDKYAGEYAQETNGQKVYSCSVCGFEYVGDLDSEPDDYKCPVCNMPKAVFKEI